MTGLMEENFKQALSTNFEDVAFEIGAEVGNFMGVNSDIIYKIHVLKSPYFDDGEISYLGDSFDLNSFCSRTDETNKFVLEMDKVIKHAGSWWGYRSKKTGKVTQEAFHFTVEVGKHANLSRKNSKDRPHKKGRKRVSAKK